MDISALYLKIQSQLDQQLPFVVYRKSGEKNLHSFLQNDNHLHELDSYNTSGFVFAPFDSEDKAIVIPIDKSAYYSAVVPENALDTINPTKLKLADQNQTEKEKHMKLVCSGIEAIGEGSFRKVVLSRKEEVLFEHKDPLDAFQLLINNYPNAFVYCWYHPDIGIWLGATPETLITIKDDTFFTMALAGTQPYIDSLEVDWGEKEIEEQVMVTDFVLNELLSKVNTIEKSKTYTYKAGTLLHLRTDIKGTLKNESSNIEDIIKVLHPTPAVCGLPKREARCFILENEQYDRKYYTGFLGELNITQSGKSESNLYVNLRCMEIVQNKAIVYIGGGITKDSIPEKEWEETVRKTETMKKVLH
ncbi:chorismate-binding protein [uncultured Aquimarina sp.]|uniref:chorismate-binding protein n=1 Tax=uncultured Aquimarina sp. TaxID=575652 RepID=UPI00262644C9|nr:chorismate-binding protein [uncultured Aquimarina sp.]